MNAKEVFLGNLPGLDLDDALVQRQQIAANGGGKRTEPTLVLRMAPSGIVERRVWMKEKPHRAGGVSHSPPPLRGPWRQRCAPGVSGLCRPSNAER